MDVYGIVVRTIAAQASSRSASKVTANPASRDPSRSLALRTFLLITTLFLFLVASARGMWAMKMLRPVVNILLFA